MKYLLYEHSVQTPVLHCKMFSSMFEEIRGKPPLHLREDFCGTFLLSSTWVQQKNERTAFGLDIDPEPLAYGKKRNSSQLSAQQRKRLIILQRDVLKPTSFPIDLVVACNFSFNTFKTRPLLGHYFRSVLQSLPSHGLFLLEMAGGPGMITESKEQKTLYLTPKKKFTYLWDQKSFDPITHEAHYSIHFKMPNSKWIKNAFTYDWRLWTIPEVRDLLEEVGFQRSYVFWETEHQGEGTGEYVRMKKGDNAFAWVAYVIGVKT